MSVKETEAVLAVVQVVIETIVAQSIQDGFSIPALLAFLRSDAFENALKTAVEGLAELPTELTSLSWLDDLALAKDMYNIAMSVAAKIKDAKKPVG